MGVRAAHPGSPAERGSRIAVLPTTRLGWWAVGLAAAFFPLVFAAALVPRSAALGVICGLAGGVAAVLALVRGHERAAAVFAAVVPLVVAAGFLFAELL